MGFLAPQTRGISEIAKTLVKKDTKSSQVLEKNQRNFQVSGQNLKN